MKRRRWPWVVGLGVGIPVLLIGGFLAWMAWQGRSSESPLDAAVVRDLPEGWLESSPTDVAGGSAATASMAQTPSSTVAAGDAPIDTNPLDDLPLEGVLAFSGDGRTFGGERYELHATEDGRVVLKSSGAFEFKIVVATVRVPFEQHLELDEALRPRAYRLRIDGVAGFGARQVEATLTGSTLRTTSGNDMQEISVDANRALVMGTFSTYAVVPLLMAARGDELPREFELLVFGGPPGSGDAEAPQLMAVAARELRTLRTPSLTLQVDAYRITGGYGESLLLARGSEFLGLIAGDDDEQLLIYRADFFPNGFELVP